MSHFKSKKIRLPLYLCVLSALLSPVLSHAEETYSTGKIASKQAAAQKEAIAKRAARKHQREAEAKKAAEPQKEAEPAKETETQKETAPAQ